MKTIHVTAILVTFSAPALAQAKPLLPLGTWGAMSSGAAKPACGKYDLIVIKQKRIVHKLVEGQGRCKIKSLQTKGRIISGLGDCDWDKSVPGEQIEPVDGEPGFSIRIQSPTRILYNNSNYGLCSNVGGGS